MLTDLACKHAKPQNTTYRLVDHSNLYLEIRSTGKKYWRYRYHIHGKENTLSIGQYPQISIVDARKQMEEAKAQIRDGVDPNQAKRKAQFQAEFANSQTFEQVAKEWFDTYFDTWKMETAEIIWRRFELYLFPYIGKEPIHTLTPPTMLKCFRRIEKQSRDVSTRVFKHTFKIFEHAGLTGRIEKNPLQFMYDALKKYKRGHYKSIAIDRLPDFLKSFNNHNQRLYKQTSIAVRLLMLTAVRTNELIKAKWPEIDFEKALWTVPAERMKMKLEHVVPLSKQALAMFAELKEMNGHREWVFPRKGHFKKPMSDTTILRVIERIGYKNEMTGHGFRALFMGIAKQKLKYVHDVPDRQLAHTPKGLNGKAYDRADFMDDRIALMQDYADYIDNPTNYKPRRNDLDQPTNQSTGYKTTSYLANRSTIEFQSSASFAEQYKSVNFIQKDQIGRNSEAAQKWPFQCLDGEGNTKPH